MKISVHKVFAALLLISYLFAVGGFDKHHCKETQRTYLVLPILGLTCSEIHPDEACTHECDGDCDDCCTDDIMHIVVSGEQQSSFHTAPTIIAFIKNISVCNASEALYGQERNGEFIYFKTDIPITGVLLNKYCALRV